MSNRIKNNLKNLVGQTLNQYYSKVKPTISDLRYKQEYQNRIIECMVGEVDDNYITTPETDNPIVKLEHSKEGLVKVPSIKGKTILVDADGNETDTPAEGCRLVSVGEEEDNKLIILSKNKNIFPYNNVTIPAKSVQTWYDINGKSGMYGNMSNVTNTWVYVGRGYLKATYTKNNAVLQLVTPDERIIDASGRKLFEGGLVTFRIRNENVEQPFGYSNLSMEWSPTPIDNDINYVPHKSHKTEILLDEPLRSLPNGVCDEIIGNKLVKRIEENICVGDVSEKWQVRENFSNEEFLTFILFTGKKLTDSKSPQYICNIFPNVPDVWNKNMIGVTYQQAKGNGEELIWLKLKRSEFPNVDTLKEWLKNNNLIIYNEKMCEIIEELPNEITLQGFDDTTMYVENSITPTVSYGYNALIPYKEELSKQKEEVETNTLDIENNIIPYLMDMEFNLMLMEDN